MQVYFLSVFHTETRTIVAQSVSDYLCEKVNWYSILGTMKSDETYIKMDVG